MTRSEYLGPGTALGAGLRAARRATAQLHRDDFTVARQTTLARGAAAVGRGIGGERGIQIVPKSRPGRGARWTYRKMSWWTM